MTISVYQSNHAAAVHRTTSSKYVRACVRRLCGLKLNSNVLKPAAAAAACNGTTTTKYVYFAQAHGQKKYDAEGWPTNAKVKSKLVKHSYNFTMGLGRLQ